VLAIQADGHAVLDTGEPARSADGKAYLAMGANSSMRAVMSAMERLANEGGQGVIQLVVNRQSHELGRFEYRLPLGGTQRSHMVSRELFQPGIGGEQAAFLNVGHDSAGHPIMAGDDSQIAVAIQVAPDEIRVDGNRVSKKENLVALLRGRRAAFISATPQARWQDVVSVIDWMVSINGSYVLGTQ
jgi:hypothetical protein